MAGGSHESVRGACAGCAVTRRARRIELTGIGVLLTALGLWGCPRPPVWMPPAYAPMPVMWDPSPSPEAQVRMERAWQAFLTRDVDTALQEALRIRRAYPTWSDPWVLEGWAHYARGVWDLALVRFQRALRLQPEHPGALVGMMVIYQSRQDWVLAFQYARQAVEVLPQHAELAEVAEAIRRNAVQALVQEARAAQARGDDNQALAKYRQAVSMDPRNVSLLLEVGDWLRARGDRQRAMAYYQMAYNHHPDDRAVLRRMAEVLVETEQWLQARPILERLRELEPEEPRWSTLLEQVEVALERVAVADEYAQIGRSAYITRAQVAALLYFEIPAVARTPSPTRPPIILDIHGHWARPFIQKVVALGLMSLYENHTFQPRRKVQRGEFAAILVNALRRFRPSGMEAFLRKRVRVADVSPLHRFYSAIQTVVALGLMHCDAQGNFVAARPVSGQEALRAIQALRHLVQG